MTFLHSTVRPAIALFIVPLWLLLGSISLNVVAQPNDLAPRIDPDWYQVEILLFERLNPDEYHLERPDHNPPEQEPANWHVLVDTVPITANQFQLIPAEENNLSTQYWSKIARSKNLRPLYAAGWKQAIPDNYPAAPVKLHIESTLGSEKSPVVYLGTLAVRRSRFLHAEINIAQVHFKELQQPLLLSQPLFKPVEQDKPPVLVSKFPFPGNEGLTPISTTSQMENWSLDVYKLNEDRKMRSKELHYIDHPRFGLLIKVDPTQKPSYAETGYALPEEVPGDLPKIPVGQESPSDPLQ